MGVRYSELPCSTFGESFPFHFTLSYPNCTSCRLFRHIVVIYVSNVSSFHYRSYLPSLYLPNFVSCWLGYIPWSLVGLIRGLQSLFPELQYTKPYLVGDKHLGGANASLQPSTWKYLPTVPALHVGPSSLENWAVRFPDA